MKDIFDNRMLCNDCNEETKKIVRLQDGFQVRTWECPSCKKSWTHPADQEEYNKFNQLRNKRFSVKLRMVGNSYTVSIPREIIDFEREMHKEFAEMERMMSLFLEGPQRLRLEFNKRNIYNDEDEEENQ